MSTPSSALLIRNARILDATAALDHVADVMVDAGCITAIEAPGLLPDTAHATIDASGCWLMPLAVDLAARLREPGQTHKATLASEVPAALAGGIGTVILPPDTQPVIDSPAVVDRIRRLTSAFPSLRISMLGALTRGLEGEALSELGSLKAAGCVGFAQCRSPIADHLFARRALEYARGLDMTVHVTAQDASLSRGGCAHEGAIGTRMGLTPIPVSAEVLALRTWISLVEDTGARIHVGRISCARSVELLASARQRGLPITADVAAHQLMLTDAALAGFNAQAHVIPPLRSENDRLALTEGVRGGVIDAVCSDHQPHELDAKTNPFPMTESGASGLDTLVATVCELAMNGVLTPLQAAQRLSSGPAAIVNQAVNSFAIGAVADFTLVDPAKSWHLSADTMRSAGHNSPMLGHRFPARVVRSWVGGIEVFSLETRP